jgi:hypothetical protein
MLLEQHAFPGQLHQFCTAISQGNLHVWYEIMQSKPIIQILKCSDMAGVAGCHKLDVIFLYGLEGCLWARNMASPKHMGSNMAGNPGDIIRVLLSFALVQKGRRRRSSPIFFFSF